MDRRTLLLSAAAGWLAACDPRRNGSSADDQVIFGVSPFQDTLIPMFGQQRGWYREVGLDVRFQVLGWTEVQEALSSQAASRIDIGINNISSVVATHHRNADLCYLYGLNTFDDGFALLARPDQGIRPLSAFLPSNATRESAVRQTAAQLRGRTIVTTANTDMEQGAAAAARRGGLNFRDDIEVINLPPDEGLAAFLSGSGDAYVGGLPQRIRGVREGMVEVLTGLDLGPAPINGYVGTKQLWRDRPEVVLKLISVWFRIVNHINSDVRAGGEEIIAELNRYSPSSLTVDDFVANWNNVEHFMASTDEAEENILSSSGRNYWRARWDDCNSYFHDVAAVIPAPVSPAAAFYMPQVHERLVEFIAAEGG